MHISFVQYRSCPSSVSRFFSYSIEPARLNASLSWLIGVMRSVRFAAGSNIADAEREAVEEVRE